MAHLELEDANGLTSYVHVSFVDAAPLLHRIEVFGSLGRLTIDYDTLHGARLPAIDDTVLLKNAQHAVRRQRKRGGSGDVPKRCRLTVNVANLRRRGVYVGWGAGEAVRAQSKALHGPFQTGTLWLARALREFLVDGDGHALADAATITDALYVQAVMDAARRSSDRKTWETVSPAAVERARQRDRMQRAAVMASAGAGSGAGGAAEGGGGDDDDSDEEL